jgi:hypothetical protein
MRVATALTVVGLFATTACLANEVHWVPANELVFQDFYGLQMTSGDLDGDGDVDISFITRHYWNVGTPQVPAWELGSGVYDGVEYCLDRRTALGDLDADGDLDLVTTCRYDWDGKLHLYENVGSPVAPSWTEVVGAFDGLPSRLGPREPSLVDIDADGDLDLMLANTFGDLILVANIGTAAEPAWLDMAAVPGVMLPDGDVAADLGDLDGDGDLDLVAIGCEDLPVQCWENVGTAWSAEFVENAGMLNGVDVTHGSGYGLELLDIDDDSDQDMFISGGLYAPGNFLYLNEQIVAVEPTSWGAIKALYR